MGESDPANLRISDTERELAVRMLGEHMSAGRLDIDEYGERSARATAAKTRGELTALFDDLPDPRPAFAAPAPAPPPYQPAAAPAPSAPARRESTVGQRVWGALVPLSAILALILFLTVFKVWFIFLLPAAMAIIGGAIWGDDRHHNRGHQRGIRDHRRQIRRGWHD